jgi:hypothetical protein
MQILSTKTVGKKLKFCRTKTVGKQLKLYKRISCMEFFTLRLTARDIVGYSIVEQN